MCALSWWCLRDARCCPARVEHQAAIMTYFNRVARRGLGADACAQIAPRCPVGRDRWARLTRARAHAGRRRWRARRGAPASGASRAACSSTSTSCGWATSTTAWRCPTPRHDLDPCQPDKRTPALSPPAAPRFCCRRRLGAGRASMPSRAASDCEYLSRNDQCALPCHAAARFLCFGQLYHPALR